MLGACLGTAGALPRRTSHKLIAAGFGLVVGAIICGLTSFALIGHYDAYRHDNPDAAFRDMTVPVLAHIGIWSSAGAVAGLAYSLGAGRRDLLPRAVLGGGVGAGIAAAVYGLLGVVFFPGAETTQFLSSTWTTRRLARMTASLVAALVIAAAVTPPCHASVIASG